ncbi:MAG: MFS transporter [Desulfobacteraceae bacterium]|nr:MFS transporter [Desulfobacteraceae bacterium]
MPEMKTQRKKNLRFKLIASTLVLLLFALGFNAMLSLGSLEKLYADAIVSKYSATGQDLQQRLTKAMGFGKKIDKFVNMDRLLKNARQHLVKASVIRGDRTGPDDADLNVFIALPDGTILYSTDKALVGRVMLKDELFSFKDPAPTGKPFRVKRQGPEYRIVLPVEHPDGSLAATINITFDRHRVKNAFKAVLDQNIRLITVIMAGGGLLLFLLVSGVVRSMPASGRFPRNKIFLVVFLIIGGAQMLFSGINMATVKDSFIEINHDKALTILSLVRDDVRYLLGKGIKVDRLNKMDKKLAEITTASPELGTLAISLPEKTLLYGADAGQSLDFRNAETGEADRVRHHLDQLDPAFRMDLPLTVNGRLQGHLEAEISRANLHAKLKETAMDSLTVLVISLLFLFDMLLLIFIVVEREMEANGQPRKIHYGLMRPAAFIFLFGINVSISFLPLHMKNLYVPLLGLSRDMVMGLPISMEVTFAGLAIIFAGSWLDKRGWHEPFIIGLSLVGAGFFYSAIAPNAVHFILSRGVVGLGYGLALMAGQGFVIGCTDKESNARGLAQFFAGVYAGNICGGAAGAMLAERLGFRPVFVVGGIAALSVIGYAFLFLKPAMKKTGITAKNNAPTTPSAPRPEAPQGSRLTLFVRFLFNRNILGLVLFSNIPYALAVVGFLNYFCPVYLDGLGASQSNIGRVYIIYGICLIYVAPFLTRFIKASKEKHSLVLSGLIGGAGFLIFQVFDGLLAVGVAVFALGLAGSFGAPRRSYILKFKATHDLGDGTSMGIFLSTIRIGQMLGPVLFGWLMMTVGISRGITCFGLAYVAATALFLLTVQSDQSIEKKNL